MTRRIQNVLDSSDCICRIIYLNTITFTLFSTNSPPFHESAGFTLPPGTILLHDRDGIFCPAFDRILNESGIRTIKLPPQSPNLNAHVERLVRTIKDQCLSRLLITSEDMLRKALKEFIEHYHHERAHQGIGNVIPLPRPKDNIGSIDGEIVKNSRLGSLLNFYHRTQNPETTTTSTQKASLEYFYHTP